MNVFLGGIKSGVLCFTSEITLRISIKYYLLGLYTKGCRKSLIFIRMVLYNPYFT
jgi:hypothetical protein